MAQSPEKDDPPFDVALLGGQTEDGGGQRVLRLRPEGASLGEVRPLKEGQPIHGEVVQLKPRGEAPGVCDVSVLVPSRQPAPARPSTPPAERASAAPRAPAGPHQGPPQVATPAYRSNWDRIFGDKKEKSGLN